MVRPYIFLLWLASYIACVNYDQHNTSAAHSELVKRGKKRKTFVPLNDLLNFYRDSLVTISQFVAGVASVCECSGRKNLTVI